MLAPDLGCVNFAAKFRAGSTHRGRVTAHSKIMWSAYFAGFGTKSALPTCNHTDSPETGFEELAPAYSPGV